MMKGLLIKDFRLILNQKRFLILYIVIALFLSFSMDSTFVVIYIPMVGVLLILSTLSYDYMDNSMSFLMTMPVKPRDYAVEKYVFTTTGLVLIWIVSIILQFVTFMLQRTPVELGQVIIEDALMLPLYVTIISIMVPIDIKYSPEKGRIVMFFIFGIVMVIAFAGKAVFELAGDSFGLDLASIGGSLRSASPAAVVAVIYVIAAIIFFISMRLSIGFMNKKEF